MWGIVIVLVGGIYWGYKYIDEKTNVMEISKDGTTYSLRHLWPKIKRVLPCGVCTHNLGKMV